MPDQIAITATPGGLQISTPYDAAFLSEFKQAVPHAGRAWQKPYWIVEPQYGMLVASLISKHFKTTVTLPTLSAAPGAPETRALELRYLGRCKRRELGEASAFGTLDGTNWTLVFSETVLRAWFGAQNQQPDTPETLYSVLGIAKTNDAGAIKQAYRRMARQWHPDVCKEPDATVRFQAIGHAYSVLGDEPMRRKYDAGLALEASLTSTRRGANGWDNAASVEYRAPLRCGLVLAEGLPRLGRFVVSKIVDWQDIVDGRGRTLVSSWDSDAERVRIEWV